MVVNLGSTKTGQRIGVSESITFEHTSLAKILGACFVNKAPGDLILPRGQADFRSVFAKLLDSLELGEFGFKPYSLRRGGATHMFRTLGTLSPVVVRGRWTNARTARIYINEGLATLATYSFDLSESHFQNALNRFHSATKKAGPFT